MAKVASSPIAAWRPVIRPGTQPLYVRLIDALRADIESGRLPDGARLPTQRSLAAALDISPGTITKAYNEARKQGLLDAHVGRGTFVNGTRHIDDDQGRRVIDLSMNSPGPNFPVTELAATLRKAGHNAGLLEHLRYATHVGLPDDRAVLARWLKANGLETTPDRVVICNGAQHALSIAFSILNKPGDLILTEAATYHGMKSLAEVVPYKLVGVAMDEEGLIPSELDRTCRETSARTLFTMPTLQNPTARTMSLARRREIVSVARKHDLIIVEDDVYSFLADDGTVPLAMLAPERTFYINSLSKSVASGFRIGCLVAPDRFSGAISRYIRATCWSASTLSGLLACEWLNGSASIALRHALREQAALRTEIAKDALGSIPRTQRPSFHVWLELPPMEAERVTIRARKRGVIVLPPSAPVVDNNLICGIRVSIGAPQSLETVALALRELAAAVADHGAADMSIL